MVLLSPFLRELRRHAPDARVTLVSLPGGAALLEGSADIDEVIPYQAAMRRALRPLLLPGRARAFAQRHLRGRFDLAIVPRWDTDHHLATAVALFSGAARRVGHSEHAYPRKRVLNAGFDSLYTDIVTSTGVAHEVERHMALLRALGAEPVTDVLSLPLTTPDRARASTELSTLKHHGLLVAFGIGAAHPKRRWPIARFAEVGLALQRQHGAHVLIVGGPDDVRGQEELLGALDPAATGLAGRLSLRETAAVLERSTLFVGNDSAPLHLAASTGVPSVEISCHPLHGDPLHNNAPERFGPWRVPSAVLRPSVPVAPCVLSCSGKLPHCVLQVSSETVIGAAVQLWRATTLQPRC